MFALIFVAHWAFVSPSTPCTSADLDGDGRTDDFAAVADSCGTGGCVFDVTLATGKHVGQIEGKCDFVIEGRNHKLADIVTTWELGAKERVITRYRFNGSKYRAINERTLHAR
jgi:hypothetical protein